LLSSYTFLMGFHTKRASRAAEMSMGSFPDGCALQRSRRLLGFGLFQEHHHLLRRLGAGVLILPRNDAPIYNGQVGEQAPVGCVALFSSI
jgi:hypothetical protein